jgi:hypothetical protein
MSRPMPGTSDTSGREALRATLTRLDERQRKIVGGVIAIMVENPERVREREWIAEQFTQVALLACGFEDVAGAQQGGELLQAYVQENVGPLLNACYELFQVVGDDLAPRLSAGLSRQDAVAHALSYLVNESA